MTDTPASARAIRLHPDDTVAVVVQPVAQGTEVFVSGPGDPLCLTATQDIPGYHKLALTAVKPDEALVRNGIVVGRSTAAIRAGDWVHTHNLVSLRAQDKHGAGD